MNKKKGLTFVMASTLAATPLVAAAPAHALTSVTVTADNDSADEDSDYEIEFTPDEDIDSGDYIYIKFDSDYDISDDISTSDVTVEEDGDDIAIDDVEVSGEVVKIKLDEGIDKDNEVKVTIEDGITNPDSKGSYDVSVKTSAESSYKSDTVKITGSGSNNSSSNDFDVSLGTDKGGAETSIKLDKFSLKGSTELSKDEWVTIKFPSGFSLPSSINKSDVTLNGSAPSSVKVSGRELELKVGSSQDNDDFIKIEIDKGAGIKNPTSADDDYTIEVEYDDDTYESDEFEVKKGSDPELASNYYVSLSDYKAGAKSSYSFALDFGSGELESGKSISVEFPTSDMVPQNLDESTITINGSKVSNLYVSGKTVSFKTPSGFSSSKSARVNFGYDSGLKNPSTAGSYSLSVTAEGRTARSTSFNINGSIVPTTPVPVNNGTSTISLTKTAPNATTGISVGIAGLGLPLTKNQDFLELALPTGFRVPAYISTGAVSVNGVAPSFVGVRGQNIVIYPAQDITANTTVNVLVSEASAVGNPAAASMYNIGIYSSEEKNLLFARPVTIAGPSVTILSFKLNSASFVKAGKSNPLSAAPYSANSTTYVPAQLLKNGLGLTTTWDKSTVRITSGKTTMVFKVNSKTAVINGKNVTLSSAVTLKNNMPMVPLKTVADTLGYKLSWNSATSSVVISN